MTTINPLQTVPNDVQSEMKAAFGIVPTFIRALQPEQQRLMWSVLRDFELSEQTTLDGKTKELIGLAVASQIPCEYCVAFHTEGARMNGASEAELQESIFMAATTRLGSTVLNGSQIDPQVFKKELKQMLDFATKQAGGASHVAPKRGASATKPSPKRPNISISGR